MKLLALIFTVTTCFIILNTNLYAQQDCSVQIRNLEQQIHALRDGSLRSNSSAAQAVEQLQGMQGQMDALKATVDANAHVITNATSTMSARLQDMDARIAAMEERLSIQGRQASSSSPHAADEAQLYQKALNQINTSSYLNAIATLKKFLSKYPKSDFAANAQYWLSESYFGLGDYEKSIKEFQTLKEKYPKSDKVPSAFLKQGYAFSELGMDNDAKLFFNRLVKKYPHSREAAEAKLWIESGATAKRGATNPSSSGSIPLAPGVETGKKSKNKR